MISVQCLNVLDLESFEVEVIESEDSDAILEVKAKHEALEEICSLLNGSDIYRSRTCPKLYDLSLCIHPHLQLHVLHQSLENAVPVLSQRCESVSGYRDFPIFTSSSGEVGNFNLVKFDLISIIRLLLHSFEL